MEWIKTLALSLSLSRPAEGHLWSSVVRIVCFVMHNELVLHEIEAVGPGLERMADHVFHWGKTKTRREVTNLVFHWGKTRGEVTNLGLLMTLSPLHSLRHFPKQHLESWWWHNQDDKSSKLISNQPQISVDNLECFNAHVNKIKAYCM